MSTTSMAIFSNPLFATYSVYARNASCYSSPDHINEICLYTTFSNSWWENWRN